jgi:hypothetical protein
MLLQGVTAAAWVCEQRMTYDVLVVSCELVRYQQTSRESEVWIIILIV